jgi:hypothetical protein
MSKLFGVCALALGILLGVAAAVPTYGGILLPPPGGILLPPPGGILLPPPGGILLPPPGAQVGR